MAAAAAQGNPWFDRGGGQREQACARLEGQLAAVDRAAAEGRGEQVRRLEDAVGRQQADLDRLTGQSRRMGCESTGFFLFGGGQPAQCDQVSGQIQRMRANLDRLIASLQQLRGGDVDRGEQRQAILIALAQNSCGPQYATMAPAAPPRPRGFLDSLFGGGIGNAAPPPGTMPDVPQSSNFRTVCVRLCDGSFFPISFSASPSRFPEDERACRRACPATEVALYAYRNPGEEIGQAMSISGRPYTELPNAFRYRQEFTAACTCKRPGESWAAAVGDDKTVERGDIVVTEEKAKALSQPKAEPAAKTTRSNERPRRTAGPVQPQTGTIAPAPAPAPAAAALPAPTAPRNVGPQFIPAR